MYIRFDDAYPGLKIQGGANGRLPRKPFLSPSSTTIKKLQADSISKTSTFAASALFSGYVKAKPGEPVARSLNLQPDQGLSQIRTRTALWLHQMRKAHQNDVLSEGFPWEHYQILAKQGLFAPSLPTKLGGLNLSTQDSVQAIAGLFQAMPTAAAWAGVNSYLTSLAIQMGGTPAQQLAYLPALAAGENNALGTVAMVETDPQQKIRNIDTTAVYNRVTGEWHLSGRKRVITNGDLVNTMVILAKTATPNAKAPQIPHWKDMAFIIDLNQTRKQKGLNLSVVQGKHSTDSFSVVDMVFEDFRVSSKNILGGEDGVVRGRALAIDTLNAARVVDAAKSVGLMQGLFDKAFLFSATSEQSDHVLLEESRIYRRLGQMSCELFAAQAMTNHAAKVRDDYLKVLGVPHQLPTNESLMRAHRLTAASAALEASETLREQSLESVRVIDSVQLTDPYYRSSSLHFNLPKFPSLGGSPDLHRWEISRVLSDEAQELSAKKRSSWRLASWLAPFGRIRLNPFRSSTPKTPLAVAERLEKAADELMNKTLRQVSGKTIKNLPPLLRPQFMQSKVPPQTLPMLNDPRIFYPMADMVVALQKIKAATALARTHDNSSVTALKAKLVSVDAMERFIAAAEKVNEVQGKFSRLNHLKSELAQLATVGGTRDANYRDIILSNVRNYRENLKTSTGRALIWNALLPEYQTPRHLQKLEECFRHLFQKDEPFFPESHGRRTINMVHWAQWFAQPMLMNIKQVDFPADNAKQLKEWNRTHQVLLAPMHPTGFPDISVEWGLLRDLREPNEEYPKVLFMAKMGLFTTSLGDVGPLKYIPFINKMRPLNYIIRRLGAFSVSRGVDTDRAQNHMKEAARRGEHMIIIHPRGEAEHVNHHVLPFRYGTANAAVDAIREGARKPIVIAPLALVYTYLNPIQEAINSRLDIIEKRLMDSRPSSSKVMDPDRLLIEQSHRVKRAFQKHLEQMRNRLDEAFPTGKTTVLPQGTLLEQIVWLKQEILERAVRKYYPDEVEYYNRKKPNSQLSLMRMISEDLRERAEVDTIAPTKAKKYEIMRDREILRFVRDVSSLVPEAYAHLPVLNQDQFAELVIKLEECLTGHGKPALHKEGFEYFGPRKVIARLAKPVHVNEWLQKYPTKPIDRDKAAMDITRLMEINMQETVDDIYAEINQHNRIWYQNPLL